MSQLNRCLLSLPTCTAPSNPSGEWGFGTYLVFGCGNWDIKETNQGSLQQRRHTGQGKQSTTFMIKWVPSNPQCGLWVSYSRQFRGLFWSEPKIPSHLPLTGGRKTHTASLGTVPYATQDTVTIC